MAMMFFGKPGSSGHAQASPVPAHRRWSAASLSAAILVVGVIGFIGFTKKNDHLPTPPHGTHWQQVFNEDFNGTALDAAKWNTCYSWYNSAYKGCTNSGNNELEWYSADQAKVADGHVAFTAKPQQTPGWNGQYEQQYPYVSGMISTSPPTVESPAKWSASYGYYEARIKTDGGRGVWPAFWLLPADGSWPPEIDIMELLGQTPNEVLLTYHWGETTQPKKDETKYRDTDFTSDWHTYAVNWQPGRIDWYVDGTMRKTQTGDIITDKPMAIVLNLAVGGKLAGDPDNTTTFPAHMSVDYVRAYQAVR